MPLLGREVWLGWQQRLENAEIVGFIDFFNDFLLNAFPLFMEKDEAKKTELKKNIEEKEIPKYMGVMEKIASSSTGDYIFGEKLTYADLGFLYGISVFENLFPKILEGRPGLTKVKETVESLPNIARWLKERPPTDH